MESPPLTGTATQPGRQRWLRLIPIVFVTYSLAYLDRSNFSIAAAGGMSEDLGITSSTSGLIAASFFAGYFLLQVPGVLYADRRSVRDLIFWSVLAWGALATLQGLLSSVPLLIVVRFLLGAVEAAVLPALVVLLARWFTKAERGRANAFLILGNPVTVMWLSAASGYLIEATSWRGMFIIEGVPALIWAFYFRAQVRDRPADAPWLAPAEREAVDTAIAAEQAELASTAADNSGVHPLREALRTPAVLVLSAQYLLWSIGVYGFVFWLPSIVKAGSSAGIGATGLLSAVPYAFAVVAMLLNSRRSDRTTRRIRYVWPWLLGGAVTFYGSYLAGHDAFWLSFPLLVLAGIAMYAPYGPFFAMIPELLPRRTAGVAVALVNAAGALGGFLGTYLVGWLRTATGTDAAAFLMLAGTMAASALVLLAVRTPKRKVA
ncbi:MFS transporter [Amycolatopsis thermoflava]|uniref:Sugar phosphate permease n=1 Tax=Amycolatopsis thermoflava TaxID=84480 RepID=A0A3N2H1K0_9PSEU|nr:MFS transporter [Amycolatopsis thermoflava]ROS42798.1 sugar phosphate permease [Amycolatopsis thermoflava]